MWPRWVYGVQELVASTAKLPTVCSGTLGERLTKRLVIPNASRPRQLAFRD